jgi:uncharacterized small protein (DUF1192 family)
MDWDDVRAKPKPGPIIGEDLSAISVADLEARVTVLEAEIVRVRSAIEAKRDHERRAKAIFKS